MSEASSVEEILGKAKEEEEGYEWLKAADCYRKALTAVAKTDFLRKGEISERLAYAAYKAAFQTDSSDEFKVKMAEAIGFYEEAKRIYDRSNEPQKVPRISRCDAMIVFADYWLAAEPSEKKRRLEEVWSLATKAIDGFEGLAMYDEYGRTYNELSRSVDIWIHFEWDNKVFHKVVKQAAEYGEKATRLLSISSETREVARAYMKTAILLDDISNPDEREACGSAQKVDNYRLKSHQLSQMDAMLEFISAPGIWFETELGEDSTLKYLTEALELAKKTKDKFLIGGALDMLAFHTCIRSNASDNPEDRVELAGKALRYAEDAHKHFSSIAYMSAGQGIYWADAPREEYYYSLSLDEMDLSKRRLYLDRALDAAKDRLKKAKDSGYPRILLMSHLARARALRELAKTEASRDSKKKFLEEAYSHGAEAVRMTEELLPFNFYDIGTHLGFLVSIKSLLSDLATDPETKKAILQEAIIEKEKSLNLILKSIQLLGLSTSGYAVLGRRQYEYGELLSRLYAYTGERQYLRKAIEVFDKAAESYQKPEVLSRVGECHWKVAAAHDVLGENEKAAKNFEFASQDYNKAAGKIPQLRDFYLNYASYMQAWSEIEKARYHHAQNEYDSAESHFKKASELHEASKQWSYMTPNYTAWAKVARAEELSRKDQSEEALEDFQEARRLFREAKKSLEAKVTSVKDQEEKRMVMSLTSACDMRCDYCEARMIFEQARVFGKKGDHALSAKKYGEAIESLENIIPRLESEQDRREFRFIISLSRAWEKMAQAEARTDPALYLEASQIFEEARDASPSERAKLLTLGHSRFCRALEAVARFSDARDSVLYSTAKQDLESAMDYYLKADFKKASEYAKATGLLLDAYLYMSNASRESEPGKKARLFIMTERVLQASAGSYVKAGNSAKSEQVQRLLENVKEERELALSLSEVLQAPLMPSTAAFPSPTPTYEQAVGLERLEHAEVQENLIVSKKELRVGETLNLEIELVNPGKATAVLDKIEEAILEGFEVAEKPSSYRVEGRNLNMRGKRLDPLKVEDVKLVLKPKHKGRFTVCPRILYLDENGDAKSHEPEPVIITVKELGISGWIKGER
jgi:exonuclease VII small subunit